MAGNGSNGTGLPTKRASKTPPRSAAEKHRVAIRKERPQFIKQDYVGHGLLLAIMLLTVAFYPTGFHATAQLTKADYRVVFYYGWITAVSTGLGVLPFVFVPNMGKVWLGIANSIAGGMMVAASYSLATEGLSVVGSGHDSLYRTAGGMLTGVTFIILSKWALGRFGGDISFGDLHGVDAQKFILILFVMTLHSASEGIGIGVSFCEFNHAPCIFCTCAPHPWPSFSPTHDSSLPPPLPPCPQSQAGKRVPSWANTSRSRWPCTTSQRAWRWPWCPPPNR